jgi:D-hydroxyproline dehydrogenase subunit beta
MPEAHTPVDVAIVGCGIAGLAHAYSAAKNGRKVALFERHEHAQGASIRNFGMVWPMGQPADRLPLALRSREIWGDVVAAAGLQVGSHGSLHVAYAADEAAILDEFAQRAPDLGYVCRLLTADEIHARCQGIRPQGLRAGLWSETELVVDPRQVARVLPQYLQQAFGVELHYGTPVQAVGGGRVVTARGSWQAERVIVCGGDDFATLYPELFAASDLFRCKLQMMRTAPQPPGWRMGTALAGGLTLRFYPSFRICASLAAFEQRVASALPEYNRFGIHVMASQMPSGEITIGDSHEYGEGITIFDKPEIDDYVLRYLHQFLDLPAPQIVERWHGVYSKHASLPYFAASPEPGVRVLTGLGGAGMTLSFGVAEQVWRDWQ